MNGDALSDLVLVLACGSAATIGWRHRPLHTAALALIGAAAALGVLRYSGLAAAQLPHRWLSLAAACIALPLLAHAHACWLAGRAESAGRTAVAIVPLGLLAGAAAMGGWPLLSQALPALAGVWILLAMLRLRHWLGAASAALMLAGFATLVLAPPGMHHAAWLSAVQVLHYAMAAGLLGMAWATRDVAGTAPLAPRGARKTPN